MMHRFPCFLVAFLVALLPGEIIAGPQDVGTRYPVGISVGSFSGAGFVDSGGTTTLSFADAKAAGLLDANGDPVTPPARNTNVGGAGGGGYAAHVFNNVAINVTPRNPDGTPNGDTRQVTAMVLVPRKPADQTASTPDQKQRQTNAVPTKLGANIVGAQMDGGNLLFTDKATSDPKKDERGTGWTNPKPPPPPKTPDKKVAENVDANFNDDNYVQTSIVNVGFNNTYGTANVTKLPATLIPTSLASAIGITPVGSVTLDYEMQGALFCEGYLNTLPGDGLLSLQYGYVNITLPALDGPFMISNVAAMLNPESDQLLLGVNGLIPENCSGWEDNATGLLNLVVIPEPAVSTLTVVAAAGLLRRRAGVHETPPSMWL